MYVHDMNGYCVTVVQSGNVALYQDDQTGAIYRVSVSTQDCILSGRNACRVIVRVNGDKVVDKTFNIGHRGVLRYNEISSSQVLPLAHGFGENYVRLQMKASA